MNQRRNQETLRAQTTEKNESRKEVYEEDSNANKNRK